MATTITLPRPVITHRSSGLDAMAAGAITLDTLPPPIPNKHIPTCPPGSPRAHDGDGDDDDDHDDAKLEDDRSDRGSYGRSSQSSLESVSTAASSLWDGWPGHKPAVRTAAATTAAATSLLYPPSAYAPVKPGALASWAGTAPTHCAFEISPAQVAAALEHAARQPLPQPSLLFPWLHGLHPQNRTHQLFFVGRRRSLRQTPTCLRGITIIKANGDLTGGLLKGAVAWDEIMKPSEAQFLDVDPREGFSVRNFHIQPAKLAVASDIIVYGEDAPTVRRLGWDAAAAQARWRAQHADKGQMLPEYNTFVCVSPFEEFERNHAEIVAYDRHGHNAGNVIDLSWLERKEMYSMKTAYEISHNVWLGPSPDPATQDDARYDVLIECHDLGVINPSILRRIAENSTEADGQQQQQQHRCQFASSGSILPPPAWSQAEADAILESCQWIYAIAHGVHPDGLKKPSSLDAENHAQSSNGRKVLIHCTDGYTESTMLAVAYHSYSTGLPVHDAWLDLHRNKRRNCFAYPSDVQLLESITPRLISESPMSRDKSLVEITRLVQEKPDWFVAFDGSFPSRILDYMYLGNLKHAGNPALLRAVGIGQVLSVGETAAWTMAEAELWGADNVCTVRGVQDNGIDALTSEFQRCLDFIDRGRKNGTATLVHCRVGVSRSATICIAEVMRELNLSFPRAYCFVRARRLNVIIQPHLRFAYELLKWEELLQLQKGVGPDEYKRELEWTEIAREIAKINRPYVR